MVLNLRDSRLVHIRTHVHLNEKGTFCATSVAVSNLHFPGFMLSIQLLVGYISAL